MTDHGVVSADGTYIRAACSGTGPPLVLLHSAAGDASSFRHLEPFLSRRFTVYSVDRRGRGGSGDSPGEYRIEQEFADAAAVLDSLGTAADLLGHSYGATVALGAAPLARNLRRLILYEPAPGFPSVPPELLAKLDALLAAGDREALLSLVMLEIAGFSPEKLEQMRATPLWPLRVAAAHTIPRELHAEEQHRPSPAAFSTLSVPTLLVLGAETPPWSRQGADVVRALLPGCHCVTLEGQGHVAHVTAPARLAEEITRFLS